MQMLGKQGVSLDRNLSLQGVGGGGGGKKMGVGGDEGGIFSRSPLRALLRKTGEAIGVVACGAILQLGSRCIMIIIITIILPQ